MVLEVVAHDHYYCKELRVPPLGLDFFIECLASESQLGGWLTWAHPAECATKWSG